MLRTILNLLLLSSPAWSQLEALQGVDLQGDGQHITFELPPQAFEKIANNIESTPVRSRFFIEDTSGQQHHGTITHMRFKIASRRVVFNGTLDQPTPDQLIPWVSQDMKVYLE